MSWWTGATHGTRVGKYVFDSAIGAWRKFSAAPNPDNSALTDNVLLSWNDTNEKAQGAGIAVTPGDDTPSGNDRVNFHGEVHAVRLVAPSIEGTIDGDVSGNAATATRLASDRAISLSGAVTGSVLFDGASNVTITTEANHNHDNRYYTQSEADTKFVAVTSGESFPTNPSLGDEIYRTDLDEWYKYTGSVWTQI